MLNFLKKSKLIQEKREQELEEKTEQNDFTMQELEEDKEINQEKKPTETGISWKIETRKVSELINYDKNPREFTEKGLQDLEKSIKKIGMAQPININTDNTILSGHARITKLKEMGVETVDVYVPNRELTKKEEEEVVIRMNKNTAGTWDSEALIDNFGLEDLKEWGFEDSELNKEFENEDGEEDEDGDFGGISKEEEEKETFVKKGDLWIFGNHRLKCGDATLKSNIDDMMNKEKANVIYADPPYGMSLDTDFADMKGMGTGKKYKKVAGDNEDFSEDLIKTVFENFKYCKEIFLWGADYYAEIIPNRNKGSWIVWDKIGGGDGCDDDYDKMFGSNFELCWSKNKHKRALARILWKGFFGMSDKEEDAKKRFHPTQKPVRLCMWFLEKFSKDNDIVVDLYGGSGSTLIACEKLNRKCRIMELDEFYCSMIIKRWIQYMLKHNKEIKITCNNQEIDYKNIFKTF